MLFSANPGEPIAPLARVASGGELARVMLANKTVGAGTDRVAAAVLGSGGPGGGESRISRAAHHPPPNAKMITANCAAALRGESGMAGRRFSARNYSTDSKETG